MPSIKVYDPAMCCSTGVCGPDADDELAQFAAALDWASKNGAQVDRYNLGHQPGAFVENASVKTMLDSDGLDCLPMVFVDGEMISKGGYPARAAIAEKLGAEIGDIAPAAACCGGEKQSEPESASGGCCS